jgi:DNA invertase Pin-like site-specific DNA recombinase
MIQALLANGTQMVIVEALHRVARDLMIQETAIAFLQRQGLELLSADPAEFDLLASDPSRVLVRQIMGAVSQYEKSMLVIKLRGSRQRKKAQTGRCEGLKPYENQAVIDRIKAMRTEGLTLNAIASKLNTEGVQTAKGGNKWHASTVAYFVRS